MSHSVDQTPSNDVPILSIAAGPIPRKQKTQSTQPEPTLKLRKDDDTALVVTAVQNKAAEATDSDWETINSIDYLVDGSNQHVYTGTAPSSSRHSDAIAAVPVCHCSARHERWTMGSNVTDDNSFLPTPRPSW
jgi:hypothetical protein